MSVVYLELIGINIQDTTDLFNISHWDGYGPPIPQQFSQGNGLGLASTWGGLPLTTTLNSLTNIPYIGYDTNFAGAVQAMQSFTSIPYAGYTTNFGGISYNNVGNVPITEYDSVIEYPKNQFVYVKLKGYNPSSQTYENWIIKEDITARPELFDPGRHPPTYDHDVYRAPPSGHALINITIVARWIQ